MSFPALIPYPRSVTSFSNNDRFALVATVGVAGPNAIRDQFIADVAMRTGVTLKETQNEQDASIIFGYSDEHPTEGYGLRVTSDAVQITAGTDAGLSYAVHTLVQLITRVGSQWSIPAAEVTDSPRFAYRGMLLDVARHFFEVKTVCAVIDRAARLKFNAVHLHLTDDQGWRLRLDCHPELAERASGSSVDGDPGGFYTREDYMRITEYAASRHMIVVPEIDLPGHTHAVGLSHPELVDAPALTEQVRHDAQTYGGGLPQNGVAYTGRAVGFSSLHVDDPAVDAFLREVFTELAELTPGPYIHFGGDEVLGREDKSAYSRFVSRVSAIVADTGKVPVAWHEAGASDDLAAGTVGQYWGFVSPVNEMDKKTRNFVRQGGKAILSPADAIYLDMKDTPDNPRGLVWANGPTNLERSYEWDPAGIIDDLAEEDILGVEAALWTETIRTPEDIDVMMFPRVASAAEKAWSPSSGEALTFAGFCDRLGRVAPLWRREGIGFAELSGVAWSDHE